MFDMPKSYVYICSSSPSQGSCFNSNKSKKALLGETELERKPKCQNHSKRCIQHIEMLKPSPLPFSECCPFAWFELDVGLQNFKSLKLITLAIS